MKEPTKEMKDFFEKRTKRHINLVKKNMEKVSKSLKIPGIIERGEKHDASKYSKEEKLPYIWLTEFYRCKNNDIDFEYPDGVKEKTKKASNHHLATNRHHPESHDKISDMTDLDLIEMVCDWTAMSQEMDQDNGSARGWADKNVGTKWKFTKEQKDFIYKIIDILDGKLKESFRSWLENKSEPKDTMIYNGKPFWIGSVSAIDGQIEECHSFEEAQDADFHHSFYFSNTAINRISNEESFVFWCNKRPNIEFEWRSVPGYKTEKELERTIRKQISWNH